jgi:predicted nucleotidyltransferase
MQVDTSHRNQLRIYSKKNYENIARKCVLNLSTISEVSSIVICGSLAKDDIIPGWSDIDIIVFLSGERSETQVLSHIQAAINSTKGARRVGIGLDIVYEAEFVHSHKLCGRPYMMTYEVAVYGELAFGKDLFKDVVYDDEAIKKVNTERYLLIAAEVHSWRRAYITQNRLEINKTTWLFTCAKALLRILQCETGPNLIRPINCAGSLERLIELRPSHPAIPALIKAAEVRNNWSSYIKERNNDAAVELFTTALNAYPIPMFGD